MNVLRYIKENIRKIGLIGDPGAFSTSESVTFNGLNFTMKVEKDRYDYKPRKNSKYNKTNVIFSIFTIFEIISYIIIRRPIYDNWYESLSFFVVVLLSLIAYNYIFASSKTLRMNHGAEHKVINAFLNRDLENADNYSRFSDDCGGNLYPMTVILVSMSPIIRLPLTVFLIYMIAYTRIKLVRRLAFNIMGKFVQRLTTAEPTEEILRNTQNGFEKLLHIEIKKIIEDYSSVSLPLTDSGNY